MLRMATGSVGERKQLGLRSLFCIKMWVITSAVKIPRAGCDGLLCRLEQNVHSRVGRYGTTFFPMENKVWILAETGTTEGCGPTFGILVGVCRKTAQKSIDKTAK